MEEQTTAVVCFPYLRKVASAALTGLDQIELILEIDDVVAAADILKRPILLTSRKLVRKIGHHFYVVLTRNTAILSCYMLVEIHGCKKLQAQGAFHTRSSINHELA